MAEKRKVKWYDTANPFAHVEADKKSKADKKKKRKTVPINWEKRVREQSASKAAGEVKRRAAKSKAPYQGTPTDPSMDRPKKTSGKKTSGVKVVKPRRKT